MSKKSNIVTSSNYLLTLTDQDGDQMIVLCHEGDIFGDKTMTITSSGVFELNKDGAVLLIDLLKKTFKL